MKGNLDNKEFSRLTQNHLNGYIKLANQKASILLTAQLAFLGIFISTLRRPGIGDDKTLLWMTILTILSALTAALFAARTIYPNTPETNRGLLLWYSIKQKGLSQYKSEINDADSEVLLDELIEENFQLAKVADEKYKNLRYSIQSTGVMVFSSLLVGAAILRG